MKAEDYDVVKVIGRGAFGEVQLVRLMIYWLNRFMAVVKTLSSLACFISKNVFLQRINVKAEISLYPEVIFMDSKPIQSKFRMWWIGRETWETVCHTVIRMKQAVHGNFIFLATVITM